MSIVEPLADQLERQFGSFPAPRRAFLSWVDDQLDRCARLGVPGEVAQRMIETGYVEWRATLLGIDLDWENAPAVGREFPDREQPADQEREPLDDA
ncbi:hypothetical protein N7335_22620 [Stutzerimonas stutzeri]|uniref:Uncharacterized protein n=1 Tax=Stutzerimonas stutzeri TaxID=316 RepID=A0AA42KRV1_STUST|nr:hypothetical protein [Stutzerimonas stutzeri]MDH0149186.1 hypothetical protein [Stutzerimonas stutzeri]MDH0153619.1 hypothetical protein [Stutzerimonas stutzeri]